MLLKPHFFLAGWLLAGVALAQNPVPTPPGPGGNAPNAPGGNGPGGNGPGANRPIREPAAGPLKPAPDPESVHQEDYLFPVMDGQTLSDLYTEMTGRRVTMSNEAITAQFRFVQQGPITYREATRLLKVAALMGGFIFVPDGDNHDRLIFSAVQNQAPNQPVPFIADAADLPQDDQLVRYVMSLKYVKPQDMQNILTQVIRQVGSYGTIAPVPNASCLIITESSTLIRHLVEIQHEVDVPSQRVATRFIKVQYADVQELADTLNEILGAQQQQTQRTAGVQRVQGGNNQGINVAPIPGVPTNPAAAASGEGSAGEDVPIQIVAASRTNEIFVMGRPIDIVFAETLIHGFDTPTDQKNFLRRKLKFLAVKDFLPVAEQALQRAFSGNTQGGSAGGGNGAAGGGNGRGANFGGNGAGGGNNRTSGTGSSSRTSGTGSSSSFGSNSSFGGNSGSGSGSGSGAGSGLSSGTGGLSNPNVSTAPESLLVGRTLLVADNITNSIVIQGPPASLEVVSHLLDEIDVKAEQVMISCVFGQLALGKDFNYGIDYLRTVETRGDNVIGGRGGSGAGPIVPLDGSAFDPGNLAATAGLGLYGRIGPHMNLYLEALQSTDKFNVISRPTVYMANNQLGRITSGQEIAVPTNSFNSGTTGQSTNIDYKRVALTLEVIPLVNSKDEVTLQIALGNDEVLGTQVIEGVGEVPTIATRELVTTVTVPNNDTIVLGGLITTRDRKTRSGIPILSQIPWLGGFFGTTTNGEDREELLIFIQPKIINDTATLYDAQVDVDARYKIDDQNRAFIDGPGVLPTRHSIVDPKSSKDEGAPLPPPLPAGSSTRSAQPVEDLPAEKVKVKTSTTGETSTKTPATAKKKMGIKNR